MSIIVKSGVPGKVPTSAQLEYGQLALNYADQKIYFKDSTNVVKNFDELPKPSGRGDTGFRRISNPGGAFFTSSTTPTGAIKIKLPDLGIGAFGTHMVHITINIFEYLTNRSFTLCVSGYTYNSPSPGIWVNCSAYINEDSKYRNLTVRFGKDSVDVNRPTIYIGDLNTIWQYPQIAITDVIVGYTPNNTEKFINNWSVSIEASAYGTIDTTINTSITRQSTNIGLLYGVGYINQLSPVVSNTTNWYRICSFGSSNASCYARFLVYLPGHHSQYMVEMSNGAGGDNCLVDIELKGNYLYYDRMPSDWRLVLGGTNGMTHLDVRYPFMSTNQAALAVHLLEQNTTGAGQITFPMTNLGTSEALGWYGMRMSSASAITYGKIKIRNGNYYREAFPGFAVTTGTITNQTVVV